MRSTSELNSVFHAPMQVPCYKVGRRVDHDVFVSKFLSVSQKSYSHFLKQDVKTHGLKPTFMSVHLLAARFIVFDIASRQTFFVVASFWLIKRIPHTL